MITSNDKPEQPKNIVEERRLGRTEIDNRFVYEHPEEVIEALKGMLIVKAETLFHKAVIEYIGYHPQFKKIAQNNEPPKYNVVMKDNKFLRMELRS